MGQADPRSIPHPAGDSGTKDSDDAHKTSRQARKTPPPAVSAEAQAGARFLDVASEKKS